MQNTSERVRNKQVTSGPKGADARGRADSPTNGGRYGLAAEIRAVEEGHHARVLPDGSILVKADSQPGSYRVRIEGIQAGIVVLRCTCPSGDYRGNLPVPCKHAALVGRRLEREGLARWRDGAWRPRRPAVRAGRLHPALPWDVWYDLPAAHAADPSSMQQRLFPAGEFPAA